MFEVLDVGCGTHPKGDVNVDLYVTVKERKTQTFVDVKFIETKNLVKADAHHLPFKNETFDKIICSHTIEHLLQPYIALKEMYRVLKPNHLLFLDLPNSFLLLKTGKVEHLTHFYSWTPSSLSHLLEQIGFKIYRTTEVVHRINMQVVAKK